MTPFFTNHGHLYFLKLSGFDSEHTREFVSAFSKKYGAPIRKQRQYQNRFGATFSGYEWNWVRGFSLLSVVEHCRKIDSPCVSLLDGKLSDQHDKEQRQTLSVE